MSYCSVRQKFLINGAKDGDGRRFTMNFHTHAFSEDASVTQKLLMIAETSDF